MIVRVNVTDAVSSNVGLTVPQSDEDTVARFDCELDTDTVPDAIGSVDENDFVIVAARVTVTLPSSSVSEKLDDTLADTVSEIVPVPRILADSESDRVKVRVGDAATVRVSVMVTLPELERLPERVGDGEDVFVAARHVALKQIANSSHG